MRNYSAASAISALVISPAGFGRKLHVSLEYGLDGSLFFF